MTTDEHQWLAEWFLPKSVIEKVMKRQVKTFDDVNEADVTIDDEADDARHRHGGEHATAAPHYIAEKGGLV